MIMMSDFEKNFQEQFTEEQKEKISQLRNLIKEIGQKFGALNAYSKILYPLQEELKKIIPEIKEYYLYNVLIGSSEENVKCPNFDLEGENSIINLLKIVYKEYEKDSQ